MKQTIREKIERQLQGDEPPVSVSSVSSPSHLERHWSVTALAQLLAWSTDRVIRTWRYEPGVIVHGNRKNGTKRKYVTLTIPDSVVQRVLNRMRNRERRETAPDRGLGIRRLMRGPR